MNSEWEIDRSFAVAVGDYEIANRLTAAIKDQEMGRLSEAMRGYRMILDVDARHPIALNNLSLMLKDWDALPLLKLALEAKPNYLDALINASVRSLNLNNLIDATKYASLALELEPLNDRVKKLLMLININSNKRTELGGTTQPTYSVIIPTHLRAKLLTRALLSIKEQVFSGSHEIIVVSDCEDKATDEVCFNFLKSSDTYVRRSGKPGPSPSRNLALKLATGKVVLFLDDDDAWHPGLLSSLDACESLHKGQPVYFNCTVIKEMRNLEGTEVLSEKFYDTDGQLNENVFVKNQIHMSCFATPKSLLQNIEFDPYMKAYEDWDFLLSIFERQMPIHIPVLGSKIYEVDGPSSDRRGSSEAATNFNAVIDYLYVYRRHPVNQQLREKRASLLSSTGLILKPNLL